MIFSLKNYHDLGRCSFGTLRDSVDTDKEDIFLAGRKVEIRSIEDLFPFLWQPAGSWSRSGDHTVSSFVREGTHWHHDYDDSIEKCDADIAKYEKKLAAGKFSTDRAMLKCRQNLDYTRERRDGLVRIQERLDTEMRAQMQALIAENSISAP